MLTPVLLLSKGNFLSFYVPASVEQDPLSPLKGCCNLLGGLPWFCSKFSTTNCVEETQKKHLFPCWRTQFIVYERIRTSYLSKEKHGLAVLMNGTKCLRNRSEDHLHAWCDSNWHRTTFRLFVSKKPESEFAILCISLKRLNKISQQDINSSSKIPPNVFLVKHLKGFFHLCSLARHMLFSGMPQIITWNNLLFF